MRHLGPNGRVCIRVRASRESGGAAQLARRCSCTTRCSLYLFVASQILAEDKLRLIILFALRYERDGRLQVGQMLEALGADNQRSSVRGTLRRRSLHRISPLLLATGNRQRHALSGRRGQAHW